MSKRYIPPHARLMVGFLGINEDGYRHETKIDVMQVDCWVDITHTIPKEHLRSDKEMVIRIGLRSGNTCTVVIGTHTWESFSQTMLDKMNGDDE
jgi:hypothetical protein